MALVCDTGPLLAALDAADPDHERCAGLLTAGDEDLVVPALVLAELDYWCSRRLGPDAWLIFLDDLLAGVYRVEPPTGADLARCRELQARYADLKLGLVDASVVALVERLSEPKVATLDQRHFRAVRPAHIEALELLP
ncbi:MAG: VapC toxin family PIN domain ribonuclease [Chloroflexi bacterium]|nr:MAG: VapC toxin family PIN domain ribonuclease [Chloroflexota bacterium]